MTHSQSSDASRATAWYFDAADAATVVNWLSEHATFEGLTATRSNVRRLVDTYYDTPDWRFNRAGYSLRVRRWGSRQDAVLHRFDKKVKGATDSSFFNLSISSLDDLRTATGPLTERLQALAGDQELVPLFAVTTSRKPFRLAAGKTLLGDLVVDDSLVATSDGNHRQRLQRVKVEVKDGEHPGVGAWVENLRDSCALRSADLTKYHVGLSVAGLRPAPLPDLGPVAISDDSTIGDVAYAVLRKQLGLLLAHESGTRMGDDPEELHDMRVATRRLRAALNLFASVLPQRARHVRDELRWLAQALGEVRDLDVQLEELVEWRKEAGDQQEALTPLHAVLERHRRDARQRMLAVLDSDRYRKLVRSFTGMVTRGPGAEIEASQAPVLDAAPALVKKRYRRVRTLGDTITAESPPEEYHELRKQGKRLRYALEFFGDIYGKPAKELVASLTNLQDILGAHQDAYVAVERLRQLSSAEGDQLPSRTAFAMGEIAERYAQQTAVLRSQFPEAYRALGGKGWQQLRRRMKEGRS
jgi:CHAD domain-containing protein